MQPIGTLIKRPEDFTKTNVDFEFQEIGLELQKEFGKSAWTLSHEEGNTDHLLRRAFKEYNKRKFSYLKWIIKEMKLGKIK